MLSFTKCISQHDRQLGFYLVGIQWHMPDSKDPRIDVD